MSPSISRRLVFRLAIPLMLLALCGALVHYFNNIAPDVLSSDKRLKDAAIAVMAHVRVVDGNPVFDTEAAGPSLPAADSIIYTIRDGHGAWFAGAAQVPAVGMSGETSQQTAMIQIEHRYVRSLTTRFDSPKGPMLITVADLRPAAAPAARYRFFSTLLWDFVQLDATLVLVWFGVKWGLRPVKRLRDEIAARSAHDLRPIDESFVPREIAPVVVTLNHLFATLRASVQSQQQFVANTTHQLRTPITGLKAQLDLLMAEPAAAPVQNRLLTLQVGICQLAHSANQLLTLARADRTLNLAEKPTVVALDAVAKEVVARFFDSALAGNIDLGLEWERVSMSANPALIDDLLSNLIDNALKYTPPGGRVTVRVRLDSGRPLLAVEDDGSGIPASERAHVLQRFYRVPNSPGHGSGLGLAIVDEIAKLYGGKLNLGDGSGGRGTLVTVTFPTDRARSASHLDADDDGRQLGASFLD